MTFSSMLVDYIEFSYIEKHKKKLKDSDEFDDIEYLDDQGNIVKIPGGETEKISQSEIDEIYDDLDISNLEEYITVDNYGSEGKKN